MTEGRHEGEGLPTALVREQRRLSMLWIVPVLALGLALWLGYQGWAQRGVVITVQLADGHGLKPADAVRYRGITVGEVTEIELAEDRASIAVTCSLQRQAGGLARVGSRFWVVRPQLRLTGVEGLETLIGPRYLAVLPGSGAPQRRFVGLDEPPVVASVDVGDLEVIVKAPERGSLARGAPVLYRQVRIGTVLSVGLTSDAGAVEARLHVDEPYTQLVRERTVLWDAGGVDASLGFTGLDIEIASLESVITGGIGVATPADAGSVVHTGHRFLLAPEAPDDWWEWEPLVSIGSSLLPPGAAMPAPLRARIGWTQGFAFIKGTRSRHGWVLLTVDGLIGPVDLLQPGDRAQAGTAALEVAGVVVDLERELAWRTGGGVGLLAQRVDAAPWPARLLRAPAAPEDCVAVADPGSAPLPLAAARFTVDDDGWAVDPAVSVDDSWHGAAVVARADGAVIGLLLVDDDAVRVGLMPSRE